MTERRRRKCLNCGQLFRPDPRKRKGYFAAWFNAWHDQNEENVLSSLLQAIRTQAIPRIISTKCVRAIELRFYLLCSRGIIYPNVA